MARQAHPLTDKIIRDAVRGAGQRGFPLYDGHGLHLIDRGGRYHWRLKYVRPDGRENRLALGHYPEISLAEARTLAAAARVKLRALTRPKRSARSSLRVKPPRAARSRYSRNAGSKSNRQAGRRSQNARIGVLWRRICCRSLARATSRH